MVIGSTWMAGMAGVEELNAREVVELEAEEVKLEKEEAAMMKFELEAVLLVEVESRQVL